MAPSRTLDSRIDRLASIEEIRQLVAKYALSLDMRDLDAHVNLFAPDIQVNRDRVGRAHLKRWLDDTLRRPVRPRHLSLPDGARLVRDGRSAGGR